MVPFVGVLTSLMVSLAIKIYLAHFCAQGCDSPSFEAWCRTHPLAFAFFCPRASTSPLVAWLRQHLEGREFVNVAGPFPWPHYRITLRVDVLDDSVVAVRVAGFALLRGNQQRPALLPVIRAACAALAGIEEVWLHRDLHHDGSDLDPHTTWRGRPGLAPEVTFHAFAELPFWLRRFDRKGPPTRRHPDAALADPTPVFAPSLSR